MQISEIIRKTRDGEALSSNELEAMVSGYLSRQVPDYQMAAWLMAVYFKGLSPEATATLTRLVWKSGVSFPRPKRNGFWIDKHSTGGVGDKTSLILVPLVTSVCRKRLPERGVRIPMVSGRGLGHSGGTLDKLESVVPFTPDISIEKAMDLLESQGFFMMGQTKDLAPADRLIYALRDVTATVECLPLIVSSILGKKLSESLDGLVLDVKVGEGAFMTSRSAAEGLARALLTGAQAQGVDAVALITRMDEPLGWKVGHRCEIEECADFLNGGPREKGLSEVTLGLAAWMLVLASGRRLKLEEARSLCEEELESRDAYLLFQRMFVSQGGDWEAFARRRGMPEPGLEMLEWLSPCSGRVTETRAREIGKLVVALGGGRATKESRVDREVGVELLKKVGDEVKEREPIARVWYRPTTSLREVEEVLRDAIRVEAAPLRTAEWIVETLT